MWSILHALPTRRRKGAGFIDSNGNWLLGLERPSRCVSATFQRRHGSQPFRELGLGRSFDAPILCQLWVKAICWSLRMCQSQLFEVGPNSQPSADNAQERGLLWPPGSRDTKCKVPQLGIIWMVFERTEATRVIGGLDMHRPRKGHWDEKSWEIHRWLSSPL